MILLQTAGTSHGQMPRHVVDHILYKYGPTGRLFHIGPYPEMVPSIPHLLTPTLWDLAETISKARMLIGLDSGPAWIASCYPDVVVKKLRNTPSHDVLRTWVPLEITNIHSHWDERYHQIYNPSDQDVGITMGYEKI